MAAASSSCDGSRAIVVLSVGSRPFVGITRPLLDAYARRVSAALHIVSSAEHEALAPWRERLRATPRFLKLPLLDYHLRRYARVMLLDDDVLISPHAGDLFELTPCERIGAAVEVQKPIGWHAQHFAAACDLYSLSPCNPQKDWRIFNSGVMLLSSKHHRQLTAGWHTQPLACRILCDQLYLNAAVRREGFQLHDLGAAFNFVGSELKRAVLNSSVSPRPEADLLRRRVSLRNACFLHLTRKVPKAFVAHWALSRAVRQGDVLQCNANRTHITKLSFDDEPVASALSAQQTPYNIERELCKGQETPPGCRLQDWVREKVKDRVLSNNGHEYERPMPQRGPSENWKRHHGSGEIHGGDTTLLETPPDHVPMAPDHLP